MNGIKSQTYFRIIIWWMTQFFGHLQGPTRNILVLQIWGEIRVQSQQWKRRKESPTYYSLHVGMILQKCCEYPQREQWFRYFCLVGYDLQIPMDLHMINIGERGQAYNDFKGMDWWRGLWIMCNWIMIYQKSLRVYLCLQTDSKEITTHPSNCQVRKRIPMMEYDCPRFSCPSSISTFITVVDCTKDMRILKRGSRVEMRWYVWCTLYSLCVTRNK